jgi:hypothetical protein
MTYKEAANTLLTWREHLKGCRTCSHGIGYTCSRCFYGEDLEDAAKKAEKFLKSKPKLKAKRKPPVNKSIRSKRRTLADAIWEDDSVARKFNI